ncbi:asparagine synthase (glutamine-hydrolyzing) [Ketobacter alkanivorans]|uniref:asparagine synthase (glutamine-hydrolyzing) n=1 Tax=Ketobacter alkanivorans TaxID=1917421 RepID=A0A2K9LML2_9GAMM|nr:asparagine synthase (glutamine-hydrolyzing) [Ketobacter alkanivorans]AUM13609.1 asparagine synthase (glutamine-hydrolyzing) [Ketobacter alkanivorans]
MCGIAGIADFSGLGGDVKATLQKMVSQLHHRGPDGTGFYHDAHIGLAHARLSIIDLAGGAQPIHNEDSTIQVIFNGEIFNYVELREELLGQGHQFYTHSDTEVIVHLYEQHGPGFVNKLNGQFAIAIWDTNKQRLLMYRDRVGIAPLYYAQTGSRITFGSEIKAILPALAARPGVNLQALDQLMTYWAPASPNTLFEGVYELPPGFMMVMDASGMQISRYWDWSFPVQADQYLADSEEVLAEQLRELLVDATRIRLRSDVPVGAYLSGGLDSSVLVAMIHHFSDAKLRTFSIGFDAESLDETSYQQLMIDQVGADHSRVQCSEADIAEHFVKTIWHTEAPILRTAPVPMRLLSNLVRSQDYKVVLTGEGSDEVLGGYDIFKETKIRQFWAANADSGFRPALLKRLYPYLDVSPGRAQQYLRNFFGSNLDEPNLPCFSHIPRWTTTAKCKEFFSSEVKATLSGDLMKLVESSLPQQSGDWHYFNRAQYLEAKTLMAGYLLSSQGDRMLMASSVEGRFPFLDHRVIEFANRLPPKLKMKALNEKYLLKRSMGGYLPDAIVNRHKQPYRAPDIPSFFTDNPPDYVNDLLSEAALAKSGLFDAKRVQMLVKKIRLGRAIGYKDNMALVGILSTQVWHDLYMS